MPGFDYRTPTAYFVTICVHRREPLLGVIIDGRMQLSKFGYIAERILAEFPSRCTQAELDTYMVMPDHLHLLLFLKDLEEGGSSPAPTQPDWPLGTVIGMLKTAVAREINQLRGTPGQMVWQRSYFERVLRNSRELTGCREYILNNPVVWEHEQDVLPFGMHRI
jgi:REP element-mobilizing transposase RayT